MSKTPKPPTPLGKFLSGLPKSDAEDFKVYLQNPGGGDGLLVHSSPSQSAAEAEVDRQNMAGRRARLVTPEERRAKDQPAAIEGKAKNPPPFVAASVLAHANGLPLHPRTQAPEPTDTRLYLCDQSSGNEGLLDWGPYAATKALMLKLDDANRDVWIVTPEGTKELPDGTLVHKYAKPTVCLLPPTGWHCTRPPGHDGPCAAQRGQGGQPPPFVSLPPIGGDPDSTPIEPQLNPDKTDDDDGAVCAIKMPIELGAMGQIAAVLAKLHPGRQILADTVGGWAVFKLKP